MQTFRFKVVAPVGDHTDWLEQPGETLEDAIQEWHFRVGYCWRGAAVPREHDLIHLLKFELEDRDVLVSRIFKSGILRKGAVRPEIEYWREAAKELGVGVDFLRADDWPDSDSDWEDHFGNKVTLT
ncbi:MAG: hypothetical protein WC505_07545 [Patescibacteria group bacterium]